jgi:hypothetical protein
MLLLLPAVLLLLILLLLLLFLLNPYDTSHVMSVSGHPNDVIVIARSDCVDNPEAVAFAVSPESKGDNLALSVCPRARYLFLAQNSSDSVFPSSNTYLLFPK